MSRTFVYLTVLVMLLGFFSMNGRVLEGGGDEEKIVITIDESELDERYTFPGHDPFIESMAEEVKNGNVYDYLDTLQNFEDEDGTRTRTTGTAGFEDAASWVYNEFESYGLEVQWQNFTISQGDSSNVIAVLPGTNPDLEPETFIIGGHLDSINSGGGEAPGADDNGSGISLALEAARIMSQYSFERTIRFATWGAEEQGLHGSEHYVENIDPSVEDVQGYFNYDMIGYADPDTLAMDHTLHANTESAWMLDYQSDVKEDYEIPLNFTYEYDSSETRSDHASFWNGGYEAMLAIETEFTPNYHTEDDILDNLHVPMVANLTKHSIATVAHLAEPIKGDAPSISLLNPTGGETFIEGNDEEISWETSEVNDPIDHINLYYSVDGGSDWETIEAELEDTGSYTWNVPNEDSEECQVKAEVVDEVGRTNESVSGDFTIQGTPPAPPENLNVEHNGRSVQVLFEDDVSEDLGYTTEVSDAEASEWGIRQHGSAVGSNSWDFGDGEFNKNGDYGMLSSLTTPEIEIPAEADEEYGVNFTFQHWRDFGDTSLYDGGNVKISTDGGSSWSVITPEEGYDG
ncbi:MAG: M28 family metallopeptidase, partial [Candidatus Saliniplasma sp.]